MFDRSLCVWSCQLKNTPLLSKYVCNVYKYFYFAKIRLHVLPRKTSISYLQPYLSQTFFQNDNFPTHMSLAPIVRRYVEYSTSNFDIYYQWKLSCLYSCPYYEKNESNGRPLYKRGYVTEEFKQIGQDSSRVSLDIVNCLKS